MDERRTTSIPRATVKHRHHCQRAAWEHRAHPTIAKGHGYPAEANTIESIRQKRPGTKTWVIKIQIHRWIA